ncbi:glutamate racemase [Chengkuizengella axinellae]|uniref:Glutamate racemase n=1 Tax=Chengkuizengella axinellae TaxID=3064388 RepID=A0ABT9IYP2_9BACL|nr:glutamate racemase [Chengkuizengella sp. 2205SS18-9]MDP5274480.1 glutamate racemase [Chengkuizengella sp. 2205SS18-9]
MQQAIAIFDSGVGGLTVVKEVKRQLPNEKIIYFGDTARTPYGPRTSEEVRSFALQIVSYLIKFNPKMMIIACNTATAVALDDIKAILPIPVVGVIHPGVRTSIKYTKTGSIGVIGTSGTIRSKAYQDAIHMISSNIQVISQACPEFVPLVEKGRFQNEESLDIVRRSLEPIMHEKLDCLILGCTHYPFLTHLISEVMGSEVKLINSAEETAREVSAILFDRGQLNASMNSTPLHGFFCSGDKVIFQKIAYQWLDETVDVKHTTLVH